MVVQKRLVNIKRHTLQWKISGKWRTREQAYRLARAGKLGNLVACDGKYGKHIKTPPGYQGGHLYDLPIAIAD